LAEQTAVNMQAHAPGVVETIASGYGLNARKADAIGAVNVRRAGMLFSTCAIFGAWDTLMPATIWQ